MIYLGPYALFPYRTVLGGKQAWPVTVKFCAYCGQTLTKAAYPTEHDEPDPDELLQKINERLTPTATRHMKCLRRDREHLWLSNLTKAFDRDLYLGDDELILVINNELVRYESTHFREYYRKDLDRLCEAYGTEIAKVRWGVVVLAG